jgi:hypothetical protein
MNMEGFGSPIKLQVLLIEKARRWEKNGRSGYIYQLYGRLTNQRPEFPLYLVVASSFPLTPGSVIDVPLSGLTISLGDPSVSSFVFGEEFPFPGVSSSPFVDDKANKKNP